MAMSLSGTTGITLPSAAAPTFSAYVSSNQTISGSTWTKITCQTEEWDSASCYDTGTYRFTPNIAGYYQVNAGIFMGGQASQRIAIYKNGSIYKQGQVSAGGGYNNETTLNAFVYLNGSTDYIELWGYQASGTQTAQASQDASYFQACMVRSA